MVNQLALNEMEALDGLLPEFSAIRVESVLAKLPLHTLSARESKRVHIEKRGNKSEVTLLWQVSPSRQFGEPRYLAYRLDTLIVNKRLDEAGQPTPKILRLGSLRSICRELELSESGHNIADIKQAFAQNAGATITAKITYKDKEGRQRKLEAVFNRYSVVFSGETLPDGTEADGAYLVMNDIFQGFLNHVPMRPLDFNYLRSLSPSACRFYEIVSFRIYSALKYGWPRASLTYSEYCEASGQNRYHTGKEVSKQMYKLHKPHLNSGYLAKVELEKVTDPDGSLDWTIWYTPGPRAKDEYARFNSTQRQAPASIETSPGLLPIKPSQAEELVTHFLLVRFGHARRRIVDKELRFAKKLIEELGFEDAKDAVTEAIANAVQCGCKPIWMSALEKFMSQTNYVVASCSGNWQLEAGRETTNASLIQGQQNLPLGELSNLSSKVTDI
jgi:hypothetical protein